MFSRWTRMGALVVAAILLTYPFMVHGLIPGHDRRVHLEYQHILNEQIVGGELYPRWSPSLNLGRGSPIFFVQYPLPYYVAWGLGHLIPNHWGVYTETRTQGLGIVLATILGALFMYAWCTTFADGLSAMIASTVFLTLPYFFSIDLYLRTAVGEIWALMLMPLAFYFVERRHVFPRRSLSGLAAVFALVLFSHLLTAVLLVPVLVAYAAWRAETTTRFSAALQTAGALGLGTAVAGVYILPFVANRHFLHPENFPTLLGANYSPISQIFSYDRSMFPQESRTWRYLSGFARGTAVATIFLVGYECYRSRWGGFLNLRTLLAALSIATLCLTFMAGHLPGIGEVPGALPLDQETAQQRAHIFLGSFLTMEAALLCYWLLRRQPNGRLADFLASITLLSYLMMTRWSLSVWNTVRPLMNIQFSWRFNVFLALATTGLAALAISNLGKLPLRKRVPGIVLAIIVWGLVAGGTAKAGYVNKVFLGTQEVAYKPAWDSALPLYAQVKTFQEALDAMPAQVAKLDVIVTAGRGKAEVHMVQPRRIELNATCASACTLQIGQFYYPAWRARIGEGGPELSMRAASPGGLMEISLPAGENGVVIVLPRDWSEQIGPWVSLVSLILVGMLALSDTRTGQSAPGNLAAPGNPASATGTTTAAST